MKKTRKSVTKRFKVTKTGKVMRRAIGTNHLLVKDNGKKTRNKRKWVKMSKVDAKKIKSLLS